MRVFIAVGIAEDIKTGIKAVQSRLAATGADVKWVSPENIHITLKFLGEVEEKRLESVHEQLGVLGGLSRFELQLCSVASFPDSGYPKILWVGVGKGAESLAALNAGIEDSMPLCGFEREQRPFNAHVTIGRVRSKKNIEKLGRGLEMLKDERLGAMTAGEILIVKSILTGEGPVYSVLGRVSLK